MRPIRFALVIPAVAAIGWIGAMTVNAGIAGNYAFEVGQQIESAASRPSASMDQALELFHDRMLRAHELTPGDPAVRELLGILDVRRAVVHGSQEYLDEANVHFVEAIAARPTSPYTWTNFATARYAVGDTGPNFEFALQRAAELGPFEPEVQRDVALYGLAVWNEVAPATRRAIDSMVANGMRRDPARMMQIAERRGRLDVACSHLAGAPRQTDSKWVQRCNSMEATS